MPIAALVVYVNLTDDRSVRDERLNEYRIIGQSIAGTMDGFANDLESLSTAAAGPLGASNNEFTQESIGPYLSYVKASIGTLRAVFITDPQGRVLSSDSGVGNGTDLSSRSYIQSLMTTGKDSVWSGALSGLETGQVTVAYGRAINDPAGNPRGFFIFAFYPEDLTERYAFSLPSDTNVSFFDEQGRLLFSVPNPSRVEPGALNDWKDFQEARAGESVILREHSTPLSPDEERYGALVPVGDRGWVLAITQPQSVIDGPLNARLQRNLLIALGVLAVAFLVTHTFTSRMLRPLGRLAEQARAIERGEPAEFEVSAGESEILTLQQALRSMAASVRDREQRLQNTATILETIEQVGDVLAKELNVDKAANDLAAAALTLAGAASCVIYEVSESGEAIFVAEAGDASLSKGLPPAILGATLSGEVAEAKLPAAAAAGSNGNGNSHTEPPAERLILGLPFVTRQGLPIGGLFIFSEPAQPFTEYQEGLARGLARRATVVIENAHLYTAAKAMQDSLQESNNAKDEFLGIIAHELRTPVTTILGGARLLRSRRAKLPEHAQEEMIISMEEESERLYRLVEDLLIIARTELGLDSLLEPTSLGPIVERVTEQFAVRYPKRELETRIEPDLPPVAAEQTYVQQIVSNFLSNAYKYSDPNHPVEVEATTVGRQVEVRVLDRGAGVQEADLPRIFERFYRSERTSGQASGKGLGLTACKRLVEAMGGEIFANHREGGGLEIGFRLAVVDDVYTPEEANVVEA